MYLTLENALLKGVMALAYGNGMNKARMSDAKVRGNESLVEVEKMTGARKESEGSVKAIVIPDDD